jgi:TPR repeat protein
LRAFKIDSPVLCFAAVILSFSVWVAEAVARPQKLPSKQISSAPAKKVAQSVQARPILEQLPSNNSREERERMAQEARALFGAGKGELSPEAQARAISMGIRAARAMERAESRDDEFEFEAWRKLLTDFFGSTREGLRLQAEAGNGIAAYAFAVFSLNGIGGPPNLADACANFSLALAKGFGGARFRHAQCIEDTQPERATQLMIEAADVGHVAANERLGRKCLESVPPDRPCAIRRLERAANEGRAGARALLAWMYVKGIGAAPDLVTGAKMYSEAAAAGDLSALNNLAGMLEHGMGLQKDEQMAFETFRRGAELGYPPAQFNLGRMYAVGKGVTVNREQAMRWLQAASAGGVSQAAELLTELEPVATQTPALGDR